ncbi:MAG: hypothetical protein AAB320_08555 [Elusimicrobiota bacterium]
MKKHLVSAAVLLSLAFLGLVFVPQNHSVCDGFLPENDLKIPVGDVNALGIDQASFNAVLDRVEKLYTPIIAAKGGKLVVNRRWDDATVNASANQQGSTWFINMYGGLARHQAISAEGFALVACHEIGHHIGGFPKISGRWATNEGGADYFATLKCLRQVFTGSENTAALDPVAVKACGELFPEAGARKLCESNGMAGMSVAVLFQALRKQPTPPTFGTPDPSVVTRTNDAHPDTQCRLDTYFQGGLCTKPVSEDVSNSAPAPGACTVANGFTAGIRPRCWYKAPAGQEAPAMVSRPSTAPSVKTVGESLEALRKALAGSGR